MQVDNVPADANEPYLELYFEKLGGSVEKIHTNPEKKTAIITFFSEDGMKVLFFFLPTAIQAPHYRCGSGISIVFSA